MSIFQPFPKIGRLKRDMVITEKIDGTNAQIIIAVEEPHMHLRSHPQLLEARGDLYMFAGSRSRLITPTDDNFGFARWVKDHVDELWALGEGRHFGEWWGAGIQRNYDLTEKRFSLFNTHRWQSENSGRPACCSVVPVLLRYTFDTEKIQETLDELALSGSKAAPGFMKPEGIVVYHIPTQTMYKRTIDKDDEPKTKGAAA